VGAPLAVVTAIALAGLGPVVSGAGAATPAHTDVMLVFDTSGSMGAVLEEAKKEIKEVIASVNGSLPDVHYGVAEVRDFPPEEATAAESFEKPWKLDVPLTADQGAVQAGIEPLFAEGGGDGPESYGRALWETATNPNVGWRDEARHVIILVADNVPHDNDLDEGIPESSWVNPPPWNTGEELPGAWGIPGTQMTPSTNRDFQTTMLELAGDGKPLGMVDFRGTETGYLPYWEHWAALSGGQALLGGSGGLSSSLTTLIVSRATADLPACPAGQFRNSSGLCVVRHPTVTQVICNLVIATASDTCTATVGDAAPAGATNPSGTITFTSANGGVFNAGNTCTLVATPLSPNVSSCAVQFLPPTAPSSLPAITAAYAGDEAHIGSSGQTSYGAASALASHVKLSALGTIRPDGTVEVPIECGFPCEALGELLSGPDLGTIASVSLPASGEALASSAAAKHGKRKAKKRKPVLLGKGTLKLSKVGKGKLILKPTKKGRRALRSVKAKGVHVTLKLAINTLNGTAVTSKKQRITLRPKAKKKHKKHH
jgi:von Willebrand factor type A domain-containing protein